MREVPFAKVNREENLSKKIEQQIIRAIQQKLYLPGEKLPGEVELSKNFGVSRTAVREAIHLLAGKGFVETKKGSGVYVSKLNYSIVTDPFIYMLDMKCGDASLEQIAQVRLMMEPEIARLAAINCTEDDLNFWVLNVEQMQKNFSNPQEMIICDINFHRRGGEATGNPIIPVMMEPIYLMLYRFISETYTQERSLELAIQNHVALLKAYTEHDAQQAFKVMKKHMKEASEHASLYIRNQRQKNIS